MLKRLLRKPFYIIDPSAILRLMNKTKVALIPFVFALSVVGLFIGIVLQISFEPTDQAIAEAKVGKIIMAISIVAFLFAVMLVKTNHRNK